MSDEEKIDRLEKRVMYLESRISMLESNAIGFPIPYLENSKTNAVCQKCGEIRAVIGSRFSQFKSGCPEKDCPNG